MNAGARILPVGDAALTVELGHTLDPALNARVRALDDALRARPLAGLVESVPSFASLLVVYDPARSSFAAAKAHLGELLGAPASSGGPGAVHVVPVAYGGEHGPDLKDVAERRGLSEADVIARHSAAEYTAFFVGFLPGFAYLGQLGPELEMPRRASPRPRVPAGSVAVAGRLTGVYPFASPGGWHLIGRTARRFFDPFAEPPALVRPGDRVRFEPSAHAMDAAATPPSPSSSATPATIEVLEAGLLTTIQDEGRRGRRHLGVPWCGTLDAGAAGRANAAVGNLAEAAVLEGTASGPTLRFLATTRFAVAGADLGAVLERADLGSWSVPMGRAVVARAGNVLSMRDRRAGLRAYVACAGGIDVPAVLGSRATDLVAGFGGLAGRALRAGDLLSLGRPTPGRPELGDGPAAETSPAPVTVRVVAGPQDDMFTEDARARLEDETYEVGPVSDRAGCRLLGPRLAHRGPGEILTDGMVPGCIQVPPDGQPIVMMQDGPTTGGYPKIATVVTADLARLAQLGPGDRLRFRLVAVEEAQGRP